MKRRGFLLGGLGVFLAGHVNAQADSLRADDLAVRIGGTDMIDASDVRQALNAGNQVLVMGENGAEWRQL